MGAAWDGWKFHDGRLYDPAGQWHTPESILAWHWTRQELQALRCRENQTLGDTLPDNVKPLRGARPAAALTAELHRRLGD